jgi:hypothetical protein
MANATAKKLSDVIGISVEKLLDQLSAAGVKVAGADDPISDDDKVKLLESLRTSHGKAETAAPKKITLNRKSKNEIKVSGVSGRNATTKKIDAEVRKNRTYVRPSEVETEVGEQQAVETKDVILAEASDVVEEYESKIRVTGGTGANTGSKWLEHEIHKLIEEFDSGKSISEIAILHKRSEGAIKSRLNKLGKIEYDNDYRIRADDYSSIVNDSRKSISMAEFTQLYDELYKLDLIYDLLTYDKSIYKKMADVSFNVLVPLSETKRDRKYGRKAEMLLVNSVVTVEWHQYQLLHTSQANRYNSMVNLFNVLLHRTGLATIKIKNPLDPKKFMPSSPQLDLMYVSDKSSKEHKECIALLEYYKKNKK